VDDAGVRIKIRDKNGIGDDAGPPDTLLTRHAEHHLPAFDRSLRRRGATRQNPLKSRRSSNWTWAPLRLIYHAESQPISATSRASETPCRREISRDRGNLLIARFSRSAPMSRTVILHVRERWLAQVLKDILASKGYSTVLSGEPAVQAGTHEPSIDLCIVQLPDPVGEVRGTLEAAVALVGDRNVPIVGIAGSHEVRHAALAYGVAQCLILPLDIASLTATMAELPDRAAPATREFRRRRS
jgi:CheY-like chemotaxis protein